MFCPIVNKVFIFEQCCVVAKDQPSMYNNSEWLFNRLVRNLYPRILWFGLWTWHSVPSLSVMSHYNTLPHPAQFCLALQWLVCLSRAILGSALCCWWLCAGGSVRCLLCGGLRDEDQYLLRHSSPALDHDSPCGQHMLLAHLEHQDKEQLQCTLARLENENRSVTRGKKKNTKKPPKCVF